MFLSRRPAVFLDRDGTLLQTDAGRPRHGAGPSDLAADAVACCRTLSAAGYHIVMVTNQPDIARGAVGAAAVEAVNAMMCESLGLDAVYVCPHDDHHGCDCRKPRSGLLRRAATELRIGLADSLMIGDRETDIQAGRHAGCRTGLIAPVDRPTNADVTAPSLTGVLRRLLPTLI